MYRMKPADIYLRELRQTLSGVYTAAPVRYTFVPQTALDGSCLCSYFIITALLFRTQSYCLYKQYKRSASKNQAFFHNNQKTG